MKEQPILSMYASDLGFPETILNKYIRDHQEARDALKLGGLPIPVSYTHLTLPTTPYV